MKTKQSNKNYDENLFYQLNADITENVATQKVVTMANSILETAESEKDDFSITIGYRALNKLFFNSFITKARKLNRVPNVFESVSDRSIEDIVYCIKHEPKHIKHPQMYFSAETDKKLYNNRKTFFEADPLGVLTFTETEDSQKFLSELRGKFNLIHLVLEEYPDCFKDYINSDLINLYFKFDVKYDKKGEMTDTSSMQVAFQLARGFHLRTYIFTYNLKSFLAKQESPKCFMDGNFIDNLIKDNCIFGGQ